MRRKQWAWIAMALYTNGNLSEFTIPWYVKVASGVALAAGTYIGGWRIMRTMGSRIFKLEPAHGFAAQTTASMVLWYTGRNGFPVSTTQVISGSVIGAGTVTDRTAVRWG